MVSNLYPPYYLGGYELHCAQVAEGLRGRGHDVCVLTSTYGVPTRGLAPAPPRRDEVAGVSVHRVLGEYAHGTRLTLPPWTVFQARHELADVRAFRQLLDEFRPDVVNWWNMNGLSKLPLPIPGALGIPDVHCIDDQWLIVEYGPDGDLASRFWRALWDGCWGPGVLRPAARRLGGWWERRVHGQGIVTRRLPNRPRHVCFQSRYLEELHRSAGLEFSSWEVIYGGVATERFYAPLRPPRPSSEPLRLLYAGQVSLDRGLHTAVEAIGQMPPEARTRVTLTVAGSGGPEYIKRVQAQVRALGLADRVAFLGKILHERMPEVYRTHDVLVFTSTRHEGQGFTMVEAMLAGCAVLTTGSGGAMEVATAAALPLFPKGDAVALGRLLARVAGDRTYLREIAARGQQVAQREFTADVMLDRLESMLVRVAPASASPPAPPRDYPRGLVQHVTLS
jgi:glycosyltransferase involved in cell wall biosynthesis